MTGISDFGKSSTTIEAAARWLNYLHNRQGLAARSCALLLFQVLGPLPLPNRWACHRSPVGDNEKRKGPSPAVQRLSPLSTLKRRATRISRPVRKDRLSGDEPPVSVHALQRAHQRGDDRFWGIVWPWPIGRGVWI